MGGSLSEPSTLVDLQEEVRFMYLPENKIGRLSELLPGLEKLGLDFFSSFRVSSMLMMLLCLVSACATSAYMRVCSSSGLLTLELPWRSMETSCAC